MKVNNVKKGIKRIIAMSIAFLLVVLGTVEVKASETSSFPLVIIDNYEITNGKIVPGEDFTLDITLKNYNATVTAYDVVIYIQNPEGIAPVYGTVSQVYVGDIAPNESKEISLDYNSWTTINKDTLDFNVTIDTSVNSNYIVLRVPTGVDSPFSIIVFNAPTEVEVNEASSFSLTFKVLGDENVSDVALIATSNGEEIRSSLIGIITPGITKTQQMSLTFGEIGEQVVDFGIRYVDTAGQEEIVSVGTVVVEVTEKVEDSDRENVNPSEIEEQSNSGTNNIMLMGISGVLILAIGLVIIVILRKNK